MCLIFWVCHLIRDFPFRHFLGFQYFCEFTFKEQYDMKMTLYFKRSRHYVILVLFVIMLYFYFKLENTLNDKRQNYFNRVVVLTICGFLEILQNFWTILNLCLFLKFILTYFWFFNPVCQHYPCEIIKLFCVNIERQNFFLCDV